MAPNRAVNFDEARRLGAELELVAHSNLHPLFEHMAGAVNPLRNSIDGGIHTLWLELAPSETSLDDAVSRYAAIFDTLPPELRAVWNSCTDRCVNVGLQAGFSPHAFPLLASSGAIAELSRLRLRLQITLYSPEPKPPVAEHSARGTAA